jgi:hypothetical protein
LSRRSFTVYERGGSRSQAASHDARHRRLPASVETSSAIVS